MRYEANTTRAFTLISTVALSLLCGAFAMKADAATWRMAHKMPVESIEGQMFQALAERIEERTDGDISVQVFPSEQLGSDDAVLEQVQLGTIQLYPEGSTYLQKWVPDIGFTAAPFLFDDLEHWGRFMRSDLAMGWMERIEQEAGLVVIGDQSKMVRGPYRVMVSSRPIEGLADVEGLALRMHPDELAANAWRHLGAEVRTLAWTEVYESIDRGIVDGVNSPISLVEPMRFYEVAPYVTRHDELPQGIAIIASAAAWNALDEETRGEIVAAYDEVAAEFAPRTAELARESIERMEAQGVTYTEIDTSEFVASMLEFYESLEDDGAIPAGFLETVEATRNAE